MTFSQINVGTMPNDGTGDPLRDVGMLLNANFGIAAPTLNNTKAIYFAANGNDMNDGISQNKPVQTLSEALARAATLNPTQNDPVVVSSNDSALITGSYTPGDDIWIDAPSVTITSTTANTPALTTGNRQVIRLGALRCNVTSGIALRYGSTVAYVECNNIETMQTGLNVDFSSAAAFGALRLLSGMVVRGVGVRNTSTQLGQLELELGSVLASENDSTIIEHNSLINLTSADSGLLGVNAGITGTKALLAQTGQIRSSVTSIFADTAVETQAGASVFLYSTVIDGNIVNNGRFAARIIEQNTGTISGSGMFMGEVGNDVYGQRRFRNDITFDGTNTANAITNDGTLANNSMTSLPTERAVKTYADTKEDGLGNPSADGYVLASTTTGVRSWIAPTGGGPQPPEFTSFTVDIDEAVDIGTVISGNHTFNWQLLRSGQIPGNLTITQDMVDLSTSVPKNPSTIDLTINSHTFQVGDTVTFRISGVDDNSNTIAREYVVRAVEPHEYFYYSLSTTNNPASIDFTTMTRVEIINSGQVIPVDTGAVTQGDYFIILTPTNEDLATIVDTIFNTDVTNIFARTEDVRQINSIDYTSYVIGALNASPSGESYTVTMA